MTALAAIALKGGVVVLLAALATRLLRAAPASTRHGIWVAAFAALLLLPVLEMSGPRWSVGVLPSIVSAPALPFASPPLPPVPPAPPAPPIPAHGFAEAEEGILAFEETMQAFEADMESFEDQMGEFESSMDAFAEGQGGLPIVHVSHRSAPRTGGWLLGLWALGAVVVLLRWLAATLAARRLVAMSRVETDEEWSVSAERARRLSGLEHPVRLVRSDALDVPVAWGWGTPTVVLPADADAWDDDRREAVLLHEMAHLARRDAWTQAVAQLALAIHWANPLAWWSYRRFLDAREQACDDAVILSGARPSAYAAHLVGVARSVKRERLALSALAPMARTAPLEDRVVSILDPVRARGRISRPALVGLTLLATAVVVPVAALQPVAQSTPTPRLSTAAAVPQAPQPPTPPTPAHTARLDEQPDDLDEALPDAEDVFTVEAKEPSAPSERAVEALTAEVMSAIDTVVDFDQVRDEIQRSLQKLEGDDGPEAAIERLALQSARDGLADIDPTTLRLSIRSAVQARDSLRRAAERRSREANRERREADRVRRAQDRRRAARPDAIDWNEIDRARRQAMAHTSSTP